MSNWTQEEMRQVYDEIMYKSSTDKAFRELALKDINAAIKEVSGKDVPASIKIKTIEEDPNFAKTIVIPELIPEELSDDELDDVAGGWCIIRTGDIDVCKNDK